MTGHDPLCFEVDPWQQCICGQPAGAVRYAWMEAARIARRGPSAP